MTIIETIFLATGALLVLLGVCSPMANPFFRKVRTSEEPTPEEEPAEWPSISIILPVHDNAGELREHLPALLNQQYAGKFEVIAIVSKSEDDTDDVLKQFKQQYPNLFTTFVPDSSRYMSRPKLAVTLGAKAASHEWLLLTGATFRPASPTWLTTMARNCNEETDIIVGYTTYDDAASPYQRFEHLQTIHYLFREMQRHTAYRSYEGNLMFRKDMFINGRTYEGNTKYNRGEYDFIVNKFASPLRTATETYPDAWMIEDAPSGKRWNDGHLYYMETRRHLLRSFRHRLLFNFDQLMLHSNLLLSLFALAGGIVCLTTTWETYAWGLIGCAAFALIVSSVLRIVLAKRAMTALGEPVAAWRIIPYELSVAWRNLGWKLKYMRADKYDFISHKI